MILAGERTIWALTKSTSFTKGSFAAGPRTDHPEKATDTTDAPVRIATGKGRAFPPLTSWRPPSGTLHDDPDGHRSPTRNKLDITGTTVHVVKEMVQEPVRRIGTLRVKIGVPADKGARLSADDRKKLETAAMHCPVHKSLHPDIQTPIEFSYS